MPQRTRQGVAVHDTKMMSRVILLLLFLSVVVDAAMPPHILFIVADDYGYNDVGYHGSEIATPNIDVLAAEGVKLEQYYTQPVCTPTRSAIMSARYPIHTGLQVSTISPAKPYGLHLNYTTLADELKALSYSTHALGKVPRLVTPPHRFSPSAHTPPVAFGFLPRRVRPPSARLRHLPW